MREEDSVDNECLYQKTTPLYKSDSGKLHTETCHHASPGQERKIHFRVNPTLSSAPVSIYLDERGTHNPAFDSWCGLCRDDSRKARIEHALEDTFFTTSEDDPWRCNAGDGVYLCDLCGRDAGDWHQDNTQSHLCDPCFNILVSNHPPVYVASKHETRECRAIPPEYIVS